MKHSHAFDRMLAGAFALSQHVLTAPYGGARLPAPVEPMGSTGAEPLSVNHGSQREVCKILHTTPADAYAIGYHAVARVRNCGQPEPVIDAEALAGWVAQPRRSEA